VSEPERIVPIPSAVILALGLTAIFVAAVVPGGVIAGPLLAILTLVFVAPWRPFPYRLPVRIATIVAVIFALAFAAIHLTA
jgi:hypothetical protein